MCKLLIITGITEGLVTQEFMKQMAKPMSFGNPHGIGYAAVSPSGELFSERWLNNDQFFNTSNVMTPEISKVLAPYANRLPKDALNTNYSNMGEIDFYNVKTVTMHTRFATCGQEFANTHPFIYEDTSLIHNGSILNAFSTSYMSGLNVNKISTCDSEAALQTYLSSGVNLDTTKAKSWLNLLSGSWAFGILSRNAQGNRILDVVRGSSRLYYMEIEGIGKVFTTDSEDAKRVVTDMNLQFIKEPILIEFNEMYRYDAITGELLDKVDIKPLYVRDTYQPKKFGRMITHDTGASFFPKNKYSSTSRPLMELFNLLSNDPDSLMLMPDIFTDSSTHKKITIDYRKVKMYCNDTRFPLIERLEIFDIVFDRYYVDMYKKLPDMLKEYVKESDSRGEGLKAVRSLIESLSNARDEELG